VDLDRSEAPLYIHPTTTSLVLICLLLEVSLPFLLAVECLVCRVADVQSQFGWGCTIPAWVISSF